MIQPQEYEAFPIPLDQMDAMYDCHARVQAYVDNFRRFPVECEQDAETAISEIAHSRKLEKEIDALRKSLIEPYKEIVNKINDTFKTYTDSLRDVQTTLNDKIDVWKQKARSELENAFNLKSEFGIESDVSFVPQTIRTPGATSYEKETWEFEVIDQKLVPSHLLKVDENIVNAFIKAGLREIPGLRIFSTKKTIIRRR